MIQRSENNISSYNYFHKPNKFFLHILLWAWISFLIFMCDDPTCKPSLCAFFSLFCKEAWISYHVFRCNDPTYNASYVEWQRCYCIFGGSRPVLDMSTTVNITCWNPVVGVSTDHLNNYCIITSHRKHFGRRIESVGWMLEEW